MAPNPPARLAGVEVVVNSYGREGRIVERALASILRQKRLPDKLHFIDQNEIPLVLDPALRGNPLLTHHHRPVRACSQARNFAMEFVTGRWIVFCDDDAHWPEDYAERLQEILASHDALQLIAGSVIDAATGEYYSPRYKIGGRLDTFFGSKLLLGANFALRTETFRRLGGYDLRFGPSCFWPSNEEADLCWRVITSGAPALYAPQLRIFHPPSHDPDVRKAARKAYSYGRGRGALSAKWIFERHHVYGFLEFGEMSVVPFVNMLRGVLRGDFGQLRIQAATLRGRYRGFWEFFRRKGVA